MNHDSDITLVLVEDDPGHASLIKKNLKRSGLKNPIVHFSDGGTARDYIMDSIDISQKKHVVLLDLNLPVMDGFELLDLIKSSKKTKSLPVLMLSTTSNQTEIKRCYELGCNLFMNKPVDYSELSEAIKNLGFLFRIIKG